MSRWLPLLAVALVACGGDPQVVAPTTPAPSQPPPATTPATTSVTTAGTTTAAPATAAVPATTVVEPTSSAAASGIIPVGFDRTAAEVTLGDGTVCALCLWVAATPGQRAQGLMGVTDLGGADGMVFLYDAPSTGQFWMRGTPMPLSIAFFATDGSLVSTTDMVPCLDGEPAACPRYGAAGEYTAAIEVPVGGLQALGIEFGSRLALLDEGC